MKLNKPIKEVIIIGGGTAGWISAAALSKFLGPVVNITLIESDAIGTVGVGEATIPQILRLNGMLGLDEREFLRETKATFKLGIEFNNWGRKGESYLHTFGDPGINLSNLSFHHYWLKHQTSSKKSSLWDYSLHHKAAYAHQFGHVNKVGNTSMTGLAYAYHFDSGLYAQYLRKYAEGQDVKRIEGKVVDTTLNSENGNIGSVTLENKTEIKGDLFIDCSGFRGLLIGQALNVGYQDWSEWLPANRAVAVASEASDPLIPYTKAIAHDTGWQWRIPLQHRTGNGFVYSDKFTNQDDATQTLLSNLDSEIISEPKHLRFQTGRREKFWHKNCVSIGLASGFLEPLESTSIHLIQSNISRLIELFPDKNFSPANIAEYNRVVSKEYELIRDFLILHYHHTTREDTAFWCYCKNMDVPESLTHKMELFREGGRLFREPEDLFREASWVQVLLGQGLEPQGYHAMADRLSDEHLQEFMDNVKAIIDKTISPLPSHKNYLEHYIGAALQ
jgi:tryptophan halogenase